MSNANPNVIVDTTRSGDNMPAPSRNDALRAPRQNFWQRLRARFFARSQQQGAPQFRFRRELVQPFVRPE